jgi:arginase
MEREIGLISVSIDLGAGRRGVDMGPSAIRVAGVREALQTMDFRVREFGTVHASEPEEMDPGETRTRYLREIIEVNLRTRDLVRQALEAGCLPLILGGDHSLSMGTVSGVAAHYRGRTDRPVGVLWVDAHTDMNTPETTPSGNIHGMSLAVLTGCGGPPELLELAGTIPAVPPHCASVLGARDVDPGERIMVREAGLQVITMSEVDERGMAASVDRALDQVTRGTAGIHLSFDLDGIDPMVAPGVGTPVPGGFSYREAHLICEKVARTGALVSLEIVELNPVLDLENRTARLAVGLITSALGKTIL